MDINFDSFGTLGLITLLATGIVILATRGTRKERDTYFMQRFNGLQQQLKEERENAEVERKTCERRINYLQNEMKRQEGRIEALTGDFARELAKSLGKVMKDEGFTR